MKLVRINLTDTEEFRDKLGELQKRSKAVSIAQLIRTAIKVFKVVLEAHEQGHSVTINKSTGEKEVLKIII